LNLNIQTNFQKVQELRSLKNYFSLAPVRIWFQSIWILEFKTQIFVWKIEKTILKPILVFGTKVLGSLVDFPWKFPRRPKPLWHFGPTGAPGESSPTFSRLSRHHLPGVSSRRTSPSAALPHLWAGETKRRTTFFKSPIEMVPDRLPSLSFSTLK
jgi:hypothetical protein